MMAVLEKYLHIYTWPWLMITAILDLCLCTFPICFLGFLTHMINFHLLIAIKLVVVGRIWWATINLLIVLNYY